MDFWTCLYMLLYCLKTFREQTMKWLFLYFVWTLRQDDIGVSADSGLEEMRTILGKYDDRIQALATKQDTLQAQVKHQKSVINVLTNKVDKMESENTELKRIIRLLETKLSVGEKTEAHVEDGRERTLDIPKQYNAKGMNYHTNVHGQYKDATPIHNSKDHKQNNDLKLSFIEGKTQHTTFYKSRQDVRLPTEKQRVQTSNTKVGSSGHDAAVATDLNRRARCNYVFYC